MVPVVILCGQAGSGKDTAADFLVEHEGAVSLGQADVLKHMARDFFGFTDEQLFGPSEKRNEVDPRFGVLGGWKPDEEVTGYMVLWCKRLFPTKFDEALAKLMGWYGDTQAEGIRNRGLSARYVLQTLGTEWGRALNKQIWTEYAFDTAIKLLGGGWTYDRQKGLRELEENDFSGPQMVAITDGRFRNEALMCRRIGGHVVKLARVSPLAAAAEAAGVPGHASEAEVKAIPNHFFDSIVENHGTKADLCSLIRRVAFIVKRPPTRVVLPHNVRAHDFEHTVVAERI